MYADDDLDSESDSDPDTDRNLSLRFLCRSVISLKAGGLICDPLNAVHCGAPFPGIPDSGLKVC